MVNCRPDMVENEYSYSYAFILSQRYTPTRKKTKTKKNASTHTRALVGCIIRQVGEVQNDRQDCRIEKGRIAVVMMIPRKYNKVKMLTERHMRNGNHGGREESGYGNGREGNGRQDGKW